MTRLPGSTYPTSEQRDALTILAVLMDAIYQMWA
jgi:hypothetical protein